MLKNIIIQRIYKLFFARSVNDIDDASASGDDLVTEQPRHGKEHDLDILQQQVGGPQQQQRAVILNDI